MSYFRSLLRCCLLGVCLLGLWGCGTTPEVTGTVLSPHTQWQMLTTAEVQLEIPPGYVGGEPALLLPEMQATLKAWGEGDRHDWLAQNAEKIALLAFQKQANQLDNINVVQAPRPDKLSVLDYLNAQSAQLQAAGIKVDLLSIFSYVGRIRSHAETLFLTTYVYPSESNFWVITYSNQNQNQATLQMIERSRQSFRVLPEPT